MAILNQELEWREVALAPDTRNGFREPPAKVLLKPGTMLCRFITTKSKKKHIPGNETFKGAWWLDWSSAIAELNRWRTAKVLPKNVIRGRMAVCTQFNRKLDSLVQVVLTNPVYAWKGLARYQDDSVRRITCLGGGEQLFIPNLPSDDSGLSSAVAHMHCFTAIDSLG